MARYIDADKLEKDLPQSVPKHNVIINGNEYPVFLVDHILHKIRNYPTADVVEVVRCKDCKYFNGKIDVLCERCGDIDEPCGGCHYTGGCTYDDGYCHHGERRKEDG